jgi:hypothetical protein
MSFLPELAECDATGEKAAIYAEMKRLGVPMVALIFRHLATLPGALEWAWRAIGPTWATGRLQEEAWRIAREAAMEPIAPMPREALAALGVDDAGLREIRVVLESYNLANPVNLLSVRCLAQLVGGGKASRAVQVRAWTAPRPPGPLAPMIDVTTMPREVADLLALVSADAPEGGARLVPSLYRHFGHRPGFLALVITLVLPRLEDGSVARSVRAIRAEVDRTARELVRGMSAPPTPEPGISIAFERFGAMIPQMIVVGTLLERALPGRS